MRLGRVVPTAPCAVGTTVSSFSEVLTQDSRGLFRVQASLLATNRSAVSVAWTISNPLLAEPCPVLLTLLMTLHSASGEVVTPVPSFLGDGKACTFFLIFKRMRARLYYLCADGHLGCFYILAAVDNAVITYARISFQISVLLFLE